MANKIIKLVLVLLITLPVAAQRPTIRIDDKKATALETVLVPVYFDNFEEVDVGSIELNIWFDNTVVTFNEIIPVPGVGGDIFANDTGNELNIVFINPGDISIEGGKLLDIRFVQYKGFGTPLTFLPGCELTLNGDEIFGIRYKDGSIAFDDDAFSGTVFIPDKDDVPANTIVHMPVYIQGDGYTQVGAIDLTINHNPEQLEYIGYANADLTGETIVGEGDGPGTRGITWSYAHGLDLSEQSKVLDLIFRYKGGGEATLQFDPKSEIVEITGGELLPTSFVGAAIHPYFSGDASLEIGTVYAYAGQSAAVSLPVLAKGLDHEKALGAVDLVMAYDPGKLVYIGHEFDDPSLDDKFVINEEDGAIFIAGSMESGFSVDDGQFFVLKFLYKGGGDVPVTFSAGSELEDPDNENIPVVLKNGAIKQHRTSEEAGIATISTIVMLQNFPDTDIIRVPVTLQNVTNKLDAANIGIDYDSGVLTYIGIKNNVLGSPEIGDTRPPFTLGWTNPSGQQLSGTLFELEFRYKGGSTDLRFLPGTEFVGPGEENEPVVLVDGAVLHDIQDHLVVAGNQNVTVDDQDCFNAYKTIIVAGQGYSFTVESGAEAVFIAGESIHLLPGVTVKHGGYLHAYITDDGIYCAGPVAEPEEPVAEEIITDVIVPQRERDGLCFALYPNPTTGSFTIELNIGDDAYSGEQTVLLEVINTLGKRVRSERLPMHPQYEVSLSGEQPGIYIIRITHNNTTGVERIIKR